MEKLKLDLPTTFYPRLGNKERKARLKKARSLYGAKVLPDYPLRLVSLMDRRRLTFTRRVPCLRWLAGQHLKGGRCDCIGYRDQPNGRCIHLRKDKRFDHYVFFHDDEGRRVVLTQPYYEWDFSDLCAEYGLTCERLPVSPYSPETFAYLLSSPPGLDQQWTRTRNEEFCRLSNEAQLTNSWPPPSGESLVSEVLARFARLYPLAPEIKLLALIDQKGLCKDRAWIGTSAELEAELRRDTDTWHTLVNQLGRCVSLGIYLGRLASRPNPRVSRCRSASSRRWRINPPSMTP